MFADFIKMATKLGVLVLIVGAFILVLNLVPLPALDYSIFNRAIGKGYAILSHWVPGFQVIYGFAVAVFNLWVAIITFKVTIFASRFVLKVNE